MSLFGQAQTSAAPQTGGLFGSSTIATQPQTGGLFGSTAATQAQPQTGGLFGSAAPATSQPQTGGLFGVSHDTSQEIDIESLGSFGSNNLAPYLQDILLDSHLLR